MLNRGSILLHYNLRFSQLLHHRRQLRITPLLTLLPPTTPKLRSFTLCWVTTPLRKPNITPQTLPQLTTWRFLNARSGISILFYLDMSVVFMVIGHWELKLFKPVNVAVGVYWCWTSSRSVVSYVVNFFCYVLEVITTLIALHLF
jgi:hypothetical protein